jgi:hypothetical protein
MNPVLIRALDGERRAEFLRARQFRDSQLQWRQEAPSPPAVGHVTRRPVTQLRRSLGSVLVVAGTRLMANNGVTAD